MIAVRTTHSLPRGRRLRPVARRAWLAAPLVYLLGALPLVGAPTPAWAPAAGGGAVREYEVKAAFLYNFMKFVRWPPSALPPPGGTIRVGILGDDPFGPALDRIFGGALVQGRRVAVVRGRRPADLRGCRVLFIASSERARLPSILEGLRDEPVLTVGEMEGFLEGGGMIRLLLDHRRVVFEIHSGAARRAGLAVSARLLALARRVLGVPNREEELTAPRRSGG